ncbi:MAG: YcxB family protein [Clostridiales bacterium]|jgi:hypothetical protein|nr:YcxB family protein [Clostridiales bacterium]
MRFEIHTHLDMVEVMAAMFPNRDKQSRFSIIVLGIVLIFSGIGLIIGGILMNGVVKSSFSGSFIVIGIILAAFGILLPLYLIKVGIPRSKARSDERLSRIKAKVDYVLDEKTIHQTSTADGRGDSVRQAAYAYRSLYAVKEDDRSFKLYVGKRTIFILPKADFTEGDPADLSRFFAKELGSRFSVEENKKTKSQSI